MARIPRAQCTRGPATHSETSVHSVLRSRAHCAHCASSKHMLFFVVAGISRFQRGVLTCACWHRCKPTTRLQNVT